MTYYRIIDQMDISGDELQNLINRLPSWRREEAMRFKHEGGRRECALSYLVLCDMLQEYFGITEQPGFNIGEHGKPSLLFGNMLPNTTSGGGIMLPKATDGETTLHFNLSHCKNAVACAVSDDSEVGIDVECLGRYKPSLAEYCMNGEELQSITDAADPDLQFTRLWTQKEALLKYTGEGIVDEMKDILTSFRAEGCTFETTGNTERGYVCTLVQNRSYPFAS